MAGQCFFLVAIYGRAIFFGGNVCLSIMLPQSWAFSPPIASNHNLPRCSKWTLWSQRRENIFDLSHHKSTMHQYHHHHYQFTTITTTPNCTPQVLISMLDSRLVSPFLRRSGGKDLFMLHGVGRFFLSWQASSRRSTSKFNNFIGKLYFIGRMIWSFSQIFHSVKEKKVPLHPSS